MRGGLEEVTQHGAHDHEERPRDQRRRLLSHEIALVVALNLVGLLDARLSLITR